MQEENKPKESLLERMTGISDEERLLQEERIKKEEQEAREKEESQSAATGELPKTKRCPYCTEEIQAEAIVCRYCNRELSKIPPIQPVVQTIELTSKSLKAQYLIGIGILIFGIILAAAGVNSAISGIGWFIIILAVIFLIVTNIQIWWRHR